MNKIKLPPLPLAYQAAYEIGKDMQAYATQSVAKAIAQRDADHLAELRAYELTVANLREQLAQRGEPAFWLNEVGQLSATRGFAARNAPGFKLIPLYTHPQAPQVPMTDDEIIGFVEKHLGLVKRKDNTVIDQKTGRFTDDARYLNFARAVEAHHGIKEQP